MKLHILGICGTFMGSLAQIAREAGHEVSGSDQGIYPPMSDLLHNLGIPIHSGYRPEHIASDTDLIIIGNALSRGNAAVEYILDKKLPYTSGPQWLSEHVLHSRRVIAIAGTHGKTTTSSLLAWLLEQAGLQPGFLIGGVPENFGYSARLGAGDLFVIEADEYDTAFFDKRSKFVHYHPEIAILNNLEFDHADIFADLAAIQRQFHHLVRTIPSNGLIISGPELALDDVLDQGCWSQLQRFGNQKSDWHCSKHQDHYLITGPNGFECHFDWALAGQHNRDNATAACAAASAAGLSPIQIAQGLNTFQSVKRRLQLICEHAGIVAYDDFAHHPTAISATLTAVVDQHPERRLIAVLEPRSNSMRQGAHSHLLGPSLSAADRVLMLVPEQLQWNAQSVRSSLGDKLSIASQADRLLEILLNEIKTGDMIVFMSNGDFKGLQQRFIQRWNQVDG